MQRAQLGCCCVSSDSNVAHAVAYLKLPPLLAASSAAAFAAFCATARDYEGHTSLCTARKHARPYHPWHLFVLQSPLARLHAFTCICIRALAMMCSVKCLPHHCRPWQLHPPAVPPSHCASCAWPPQAHASPQHACCAAHSKTAGCSW